MKNASLNEKIGSALIIIGLIILAVAYFWKSNPLQISSDVGIFFNSVGLIFWALGRRKRLAQEKKKNHKS